MAETRREKDLSFFTSLIEQQKEFMNVHHSDIKTAVSPFSLSTCPLAGKDREFGEGAAGDKGRAAEVQAEDVGGTGAGDANCSAELSVGKRRRLRPACRQRRNGASRQGNRAAGGRAKRIGCRDLDHHAAGQGFVFHSDEIGVDLEEKVAGKAGKKQFDLISNTVRTLQEGINEARVAAERAGTGVRETDLYLAKVLPTRVQTQIFQAIHTCFPKEIRKRLVNCDTEHLELFKKETETAATQLNKTMFELPKIEPVVCTPHQESKQRKQQEREAGVADPEGQEDEAYIGESSQNSSVSAYDSALEEEGKSGPEEIPVQNLDPLTNNAGTTPTVSPSDPRNRLASHYLRSLLTS